MKAIKPFASALVATMLAVIVWLLPDRTMVEPAEARWLMLTLGVFAWIMCALVVLFASLEKRGTAVPFAVALFRVVANAGGWVMVMVAGIIALVGLKNL